MGDVGLCLASLLILSKWSSWFALRAIGPYSWLVAKSIRDLLPTQLSSASHVAVERCYDVRVAVCRSRDHSF